MTTLQERPNSALLVIDVQNDVMSGTHNRDGVIANIAALIEKARTNDVPVVWVQHSDDNLPKGSEGREYVAELKLGGDEPVVHKNWASIGATTPRQAGKEERSRPTRSSSATEQVLRASAPKALRTSGGRPRPR